MMSSVSNGSPRSDVERHYLDLNLRADLSDARHGHPGTQCGSFLSPSVNANSNLYDTFIGLSSPGHHYNSSSVPASSPLPLTDQSDLSVSVVNVEPSHIQPPEQFKTENTYPPAITTSQQTHFSSMSTQDFQGQEPPASNASLSTLTSKSTLSLAVSGSDSSTFIGTSGSRSQMAFSDRPEAGGYPERLTSKPSREFLPHVNPNHQPTLIPPPTGSVGIGQAVSFDSSKSSVSHFSPDTGARLSHDYLQPVGDLHSMSRLASTSLQSMTSSRPIRPLPLSSSPPAWCQGPAVNTQGYSSPSNTATHEAFEVHSHPTKHSSSQSKSPAVSSSTQRSSISDGVRISQSTFRRPLDNSGLVNDDEDLYDYDDSQAGSSPAARSGKGKGREFDTTTESIPQKREMDEYPKEETRKGAVGGPRIPSACDACKMSKVRCVFPDKKATSLSSYNDSLRGQHLSRCERCVLHGLECRVSGRKKRDPPPSQNELEQKNDSCSMKLLEHLFQLISGSGNFALTNVPHPFMKEWRHTTETTLASPMSTSSSVVQAPSTQTFMPQISSSGPSYPKSSNPYPQLNQPVILPGPSRTMLSLSDLPPLPVFDKATSRAKREAKIERWIAEAIERLIKLDYAQPLQTIPPLKGGNESGHSQWEKGTQVQNEREYQDTWKDRTPPVDLGVSIEETNDIEEDGDHVLDSKHMLHATRAYLFGERSEASLFEDIPQKRLPPILSKKIITPTDVPKLFDIFFDKMNMFFSACDPAIHTPFRVLRSSTFLFTTICAVASKHYTERPELYPILLEYAKEAAGQAIHGPKTVETTQAFLLLGVHMPPSRNFTSDRAYLFLGLAIRIAIDIELYRPQYTYEPHPDTPEDQARRLLNRGRTWLNCFCNDRSISTQMGKATGILIRGPPIPFNIKTWWCSSKWNLPSDIHMCAYADLLSVMADFHDVVYLDAYSADGRKKPLNLDLVQQYADKVSAVQQTWTDIISSRFPHRDDIKLAWRDNLWPFLSNYAKLVILSIGLRNGMLQGLTDKNPFSEQSIAAACALLTQVLDKLANLGYMRYCVEAYFVFMGFAAAFLLKILRRKFSFMRKPGQDEKIIDLVERLIALLGSDEVAIDDRHTPKLYSQFLGDVLTQYKRTHMHQGSDADQNGNHPNSQKVPGNDETNFVQTGPFSYDTSASAQPMEDVQISVYSQDTLRPTDYPDPRFNTANNIHSMADVSPAMDLDIPLPASYTRNEDTLLSMLPLEDPAFWDHLGMPLVTNPETWPQVVDMTHGTGAGLYNPLQVHNPFQNNQTNYRTYGSGMGSSFERSYRLYH